MKKAQLSDEQLEKILSDMPKVKDHRDPRDIYMNIAQQVEKKRKPQWIFPAAAAAAVMFLAFNLLPGLTEFDQSGDKSIENSQSFLKQKTEMKESADEAIVDQPSLQKSGIENEESLNDAAKENMKSSSLKNEAVFNPYESLTSLYPNEAIGKTVISYSVPDQKMETLVPVTVAVPVPDAREKRWINLFTESMSKLKEEEWGLQDYYPIDAKFAYDEAAMALKVDFSEEGAYKDGAVANTMFLEAMEQNLAGRGIGKLIFTTKGEPGVDLGHYGVRSEHVIPHEPSKGRAYLFFYPKDSSQPYLVPTKKSFDSFEQALGHMKKSGDKKTLRPSIPSSFKPGKIETGKNKDTLMIYIADVQLNDEFILPLEAILLTAKEFGYQKVKIETAGSHQVGPFDLKEEILVPAGPNKKHIQ